MLYMIQSPFRCVFFIYQPVFFCSRDNTLQITDSTLPIIDTLPLPDPFLLFINSTVANPAYPHLI